MKARNHYSKDFKLEAVRLLLLGTVPVAQLARKLGIRRRMCAF
ncbi:MAG: transposase [Rhodospirillaceae bacterium]|jgi:transposase-like protein|nr:transposase [Rhodospirillaceae bacterium]MBT4116842.1 transposase [Rhodospirillaceae bacterium]MBT4671998.1 transposase [Rhodospirillaceae bacterium]MBT4718716.1 transposase [Rhodospirillaceae bacterium]MBT4749708.1 transposase [Rhodospirillaceae bacterium]